MNNWIKGSIKDFTSYDAKRDLSGIVLDANENEENFYLKYKEEIIKELDNISINRYPDFDGGKVRNSLASYANVIPENIIIGNGSDELLSIIVDAFIEIDDSIVTISPTFSMYEIYGKVAGGNIINIERDENFNFNVDEVINKAKESKAKLIFLCNPNNPTGTSISQDDIVKVIENTSSLVVLDEAYYEFFGETLMESIGKYPNLIILRTLSKAFGLAGARIGYGVSSKEIIEVLYKVKPPYNVNSLTCAFGLVYLNHTDEILYECSKIIERREKLYKEFLKREEVKVYESRANFLLIKVIDGNEVINRLEEEKIRVRKYSGGRLLNYLRITIGSEKTNNNLIRLVKEGYFG